LPDSFNLNLLVDGDVGSVEFTVTNIDTGVTETILENVAPYTYPAGGGPWNLGTGTFAVSAKLYEFSNTCGDLCDELNITFTIIEEGICEADAGTLTSDQNDLCIVDDGKFVFDPIEISATPNGDAQVPAGFSTIYVLTTGADLVIIDSSTSPVFEVIDEGEYNIHTLVYDPTTLDIGIIEIGVTTASDILALLIQGGGDICASLDVTGDPIIIINPDSGTITPNVTPVFLNTDGEATISATPNGNQNVPEGYEIIYVLTKGAELLIMNAGPIPEFVVNEAGDYIIHTFIYDPATFDLGIIDFGVSTAGYVLDLLIQGGGDICGSLDVNGAPIVVQECLANAGTLTVNSLTSCIPNGSGTISVTPNNDSVIPVGFVQHYLVSEGANSTVLGISSDPSFPIGQASTYTIHSFVYHPNTFDPASDIETGVTTSQDIFELTTEGGGNICASIDGAGVAIIVEDPQVGTITAENNVVILEGAVVDVNAIPDGNSNVPNGYETGYLFTLEPGLVIKAISDSPSFMADTEGYYRIHTLVYDPTTLDINNDILINEDAIADIAALMTQGGGNICGSLDEEGAQIEVMILSFAEVMLYPNPATSIINVDAKLRDNEILNYAIVDLSGRLISKGLINSTNGGENDTINLEALKNGMYLVSFSSQYRKITKTIKVSH